MAVAFVCFGRPGDLSIQKARRVLDKTEFFDPLCCSVSPWINSGHRTPRQLSTRPSKHGLCRYGLYLAIPIERRRGNKPSWTLLARAHLDGPVTSDRMPILINTGLIPTPV
jgi:hypothetical protein